MELDAVLATYSQQHTAAPFRGAVLVRRGSELLLDDAYGLADGESGRPNTPETAFQIASISKQFAAAAVLLLQERGLLAVHDAISTWIPQCPASWEPISVQHLLTHTSGLGDWRDFPELSFYRPVKREQLMRGLQRRPLKFAPGSGWAYSGPGYRLLAHIVERVTGSAYATFLRAAIFAPLDMRSTCAGQRAPEGIPQASGYRGAERRPSIELETVCAGEGDIWSTTRDLARWNAALAAPGLLRAASLQAMFTPHARVPDIFMRQVIAELAGIGDDDAYSYGYGWFLGTANGHQLRFHPGVNPGFLSMNVQLPDQDIAVILLSNDEQSGCWSLSRALVAALVRD